MPRIRPILPANEVIEPPRHVPQNVTSGISVTPVHLQHPPPAYVNPPFTPTETWQELTDQDYLDATGLDDAEAALDSIDPTTVNVRFLFLGMRRRFRQRQVNKAEDESREAVSTALSSLSGARAHTIGASSFVPQRFTPLDADKPVIPRYSIAADGTKVTHNIKVKSYLNEDREHLHRAKTFARLSQRYDVVPTPTNGREDRTDITLMDDQTERLEMNLEARTARGQYPVGRRNEDKRHPFQRRRGKTVTGRAEHAEHEVHELDEKMVRRVYKDGRKASKRLRAEAVQRTRLAALDRAIVARRAARP